MKVRNWRGWSVAILAAAGLAAGPANAEDAPKAVDDYNFAAWLYNTGKYGLAVEAYENFLKAYPKHAQAADARFGLAQSLFHQDRFADAAGQYEAIRASAANFAQMPEVTFQLAQCRIAAGEYDQADAALLALRKAFPEHYLSDWALARRGACLVSLAKYKEAAAELDAFLAVYAPAGQDAGKVPATRTMLKRLADAGIKSEDAFLGLIERSRFYRALSAFNQADFAGARARFEAFLDAYPRSAMAAEARFRLAQSLYRAEAYARAAEIYAEAAAGGGEFAEAAGFERGLALHKAGKLKAAAEAFAEGARAFPSGKHAAKARLYAGTFLYDAGDYAGAAERLRPLRDAGGDLADEAAYWLGMALLKTGKAPEAEQTLDGASQAYPDSRLKADMLLGLADARLAQNRLGEAAEAFARYAKDYPDSEQAPLALYSACVALHKAGAYGPSDERCAEVLDRFAKRPQAPDALFLSGENRFLQKQYDRAAERYRAVLKRGDAPAERAARAQFRLAWIERYAGRFDAALKALDAVDRAAAGPAVAAECLYLRGVCLFETGKHAEAVTAFGAYLDEKDNARFGDDALLKLAVAEARQGRHKEAVKRLERFAKDYPASELAPQAQYQLAESCYDLKSYADAAAAYRGVADSQHAGDLKPYALFGLALCANDQGDWAAAAAGFEAVAIGFPASDLAPQARYRQGTALVKGAQWSGAEQAFGALLDKAPKHALARAACMALGTCRQEQKKWAEAAEAFKRVLADYAAGADDARVRYELAWSLREAGQADAALAAFAQLAATHAQDPLAADAYFHLAEDKYRERAVTNAPAETPAQKTQRLDEARALYERVLGVAADNRLADKALYRSGWCWWLTQKYAEAAAAFDAVVAQHPASALIPDALFQSGQSYARAGQPARAIERLERLCGDDAFANFQYRPDALVALAENQLILTRPEDAERTIGRFVKTFAQHPSAAQAFFVLGKAQYDRRAYKAALASFERVTALTRSETAAQAQFYVGQVHQAQADYAAALVAYLRVQALYPGMREWVAGAVFESGKCQDALGQTAEARKAFEEVAGAYKDTRWGPLAAERLLKK